MQKATVTAAQPTGQWESSYGTLYTFNVTLSDGANGEVNSKSPQLRFNIGDEVEYESPKPGKLKLNKPNPNGGSYSNNTGGARSSYSGGGKDYSKQHALNAACTYLNGTKASKEQIVFLADYFAKWLKGDSAPAQVQQAAPAEVPSAPAPAPAPTPAPAPADAFNSDDDGLPF